jgi:hypothetical protein
VRLAATILLLFGIAGAGVTLALALGGVGPALATSIAAAWWLALTIAIGALVATMTLNVAHATWFVIFRPLVSSIAATLPLLALGLLPAALVAHHVYPWAGATEGLPREILERLARTRPWMSPWPVYLRTLVSLGIWSTFALALHAKAASSRARVASGIGIPILGITATVTPFDWMMRIEPAWKSTIYGMYVVVGGFSGAMGLVAVLAWLAMRSGRIRAADVKPDHFHAHGRLMLTAICLWAYLAFFQMMLIWIGNVPAEVTFFVARSSGPWGRVAWILAIGHFVLPFLALLSRPLKRDPERLAAVGAWMVVMHVVDVVWLMFPSRLSSVPAVALAPFAAVCGLGGAWGLWRYAALLPVASRDPDFPRGAGYESP